MTDVVRGGMYRGENTTVALSSDRRYAKIKDGSGVVQDVPLMQYVSGLERQILALGQEIAIRDTSIERLTADLRRLTASVKKIEGRLR